MLRGPKQNLLHTRTQRPHRDWPAQPLAEEALPIAEKIREAKGKGEKERYIHLNAEFQRIARRDKKAFLCDQCKETEESNRIGKTSDLFKKFRNTKGAFHAKMGSIKDRDGMNLTGADDIKRWKEYKEELYKKILMTQITMIVWSLTRARHPGMLSQVGLRKHHYTQS